jgi:hypothetical protein
MTKQKLLIFLVTGLICTNLLLVGFLFFRRMHHPPQPKHLIIDKLKFDGEQIQKFESNIKTHRDKVKEEEKKILSLKNELYSNLSKSQSNVNDSLINEISKVTASLENIHISHFKEIKSICRENQLSAYEELTKEFSGLFNTRRRKKH